MKTNKLQCILASFLLLTGNFLTSSCNHEIRPTSYEVEDSVRHYYPIPEGHELTVNYDLKNTGKYPLIISDIQTSCGCVAVSKYRHIIPPDTQTTLSFKYQSYKNIGLVENSIFLFGNFNTGSMLVLRFDVHVVPSSDHIRDYEEMYELNRQFTEMSNKHLNSTSPSANYYVENPE